MKKWIIGILLIAIIVTGALFIRWYRNINTKVFVPRTVTAEKPPDTIPQHLADKTPFDVLLLGYGGSGHDGPYLTDTMMDIHIDPTSQKILLISIPRDLWVNIPTTGTGQTPAKINAAYAIGLDDTIYPAKLAQYSGPDGGGRLAEFVTGQVTGLPVDYFIGVDFSGFTKTIDTIGGVDINVQPSFDDPAYPDEASASATCGHSPEDIQAFTATVSAEPDIWSYFSCRYMPVHFNAGLQHMDGARALVYARSRHSAQDGTDFGRAKRQQNLLVAVKQKIFSIGFITKIVPFIDSLKNDVSTDLAPSDIQVLMQNAAALSKYDIVSLALTDKNYLTDAFSDSGQSILIPKDGQNNYTTIHSWVSDILAGHPEPLPAVVLIENGTKTPGLAQTATNKLINKNIQTLPASNTGGVVYQTSSVTAYGTIIPSDLTLLKQEFSGLTFSSQPATTSAYNIRIVLGNDYKNLPSAAPGK